MTLVVYGFAWSNFAPNFRGLIANRITHFRIGGSRYFNFAGPVFRNLTIAIFGWR